MSAHVPGQAPALIRLDGLGKTFQSGEIEVHAVRQVSLTVQAGDFVAIMGASGSGKSTLMNIIGCLDKPTAGRYELDGTDVSVLDRRQLAVLRNRNVGFVFQSFNLLARTSAAENTELPLLYALPRVSSKERKRRAIEALTRVGLEKRLDHHPSQLSGGQQQRIAIARALVGRPHLVLADEPTGNLDTRTSVEIMGLFQELNAAGITIVMVTHELDIASYCKRLVVMRDGRIVSDTQNDQQSSAPHELARLSDAEALVQLV
jgi:putative ABC transport system ATP-binding protein